MAMQKRIKRQIQKLKCKIRRKHTYKPVHGMFGDNPRVVFMCTTCGKIGLYHVDTNEHLNELVEQHKLHTGFGW